MAEIDLINKKFGRLTAIERTNEKKHNTYIWKCICECGNEKLVPSKFLRSGGVSSCGCLVNSSPNRGKQDNGIDLTGQVYNLLTVLQLVKKVGRIWKCRCECGNELDVSTKRLRQYKDTISCGCKSFGTDFTGIKRNFLTVTGLSHLENRVRFWKCRCECGNEIITNITDLKNGKIKSCGCMSEWMVNNKYKGYRDISGMYWCSVRGNVNRGNGREIEFSITMKDVWDLYEKQDRKCKYSGVPISFSDRNGKGTRTASIDRIDSDKGYTLDNIAIVHKDVNVFKMNMSLEELYNWCLKISETLKHKF